MRRPRQLALLLLVATVSACAPDGDPSAFVTFNIPPDSRCIVSPSRADVFIPIGRYDISPGARDGCEHPYFVNLLINSFLRPGADDRLGRAEVNYLQIHSAEVRLMNVKKETLAFDQVEPALPNPFLVTTNNSLPPARGTSPSVGVAAVEVIPVDYADQLFDLVGGQILAEIQVFGTTTGDIEVDFKPFTFPIEICDECLTICAGDVGGMNQPTMDDLVGDNCFDNSGADGRVCIDPDC